jgi:hypothetical protein
VQDAQTTVVLAANQIAINAFFMLSPLLKTNRVAKSSTAKSFAAGQFSIETQPLG